MQKGGWLAPESIPSAYESVGNKWVYFYGDVTMRPIATTFLLPSHGKELTTDSTTNKAYYLMIYFAFWRLAKEMHDGGKEWANSKVLLMDIFHLRLVVFRDKYPLFECRRYLFCTPVHKPGETQSPCGEKGRRAKQRTCESRWQGPHMHLSGIRGQWKDHIRLVSLAKLHSVWRFQCHFSVHP